MNNGSKFCPKCKQEKSRNEFYKNASSRDGLQTYCKPCLGHSVRKYQKSAKGRRVLIDSVRKWQTNNREYVSQKSREHRQDHPNRAAARLAVTHAVKSGELPHISGQKCVQCGGVADHYHHHKGYDKKYHLDVIPVCSKCHGREHRPGSKYDDYEYDR